MKKIIGTFIATVGVILGFAGVANAATAHDRLYQVDLETACHVTLRDWNNSIYQIQGKAIMHFTSHTNFYVPINKSYYVLDLHNDVRKGAIC